MQPPAQSFSRIAICIATCSRPAWLERLLRAIAVQDLHVCDPSLLMVVVCDNDVHGSAQPIVARLQEEFPWRLEYVLETTRGIPHARNASVERALALDAEVLVFIDDDEIPPSNWLELLIRGQRAHRAHVVVGPVYPDYESSVPSWVRSGKFFERSVRPSGTVLKSAATNNTLVLRAVFETVGRFDERFALNGGDDSDFFMRALLAGARIVAVSEAGVRETVPVSRASGKWLIRRAYRLYNSHVLCERKNLPLTEWFPRRLATTAVRLAGGLFILPLAILGGPRTTVRAAQELAKAAGAISGLFGFSYQEYRTLHGR